MTTTLESQNGLGINSNKGVTPHSSELRNWSLTTVGRGDLIVLQSIQSAYSKTCRQYRRRIYIYIYIERDRESKYH